jgi:hypothetical protein
MINQLAFPGLGTLLAARKIGFAQAALMLVGFFVATGYICWFIYHQIQLLFDMNTTAQQFSATRFEHWQIGAIGLGICAVAWTWSLVTSIRLILAAPENTPMPPAIPPKISE